MLFRSSRIVELRKIGYQSYEAEKKSDISRKGGEESLITNEVRTYVPCSYGLALNIGGNTRAPFPDTNSSFLTICINVSHWATGIQTL